MQEGMDGKARENGYRGAYLVHLARRQGPGRQRMGAIVEQGARKWNLLSK